MSLLPPFSTSLIRAARDRKRGLAKLEAAARDGWKVAPTPRLRVKRGQITGDWIWRVLGADNEWLTFGRAATHAEALAVGLAALETASLTGSR